MLVVRGLDVGVDDTTLRCDELDLRNKAVNGRYEKYLVLVKVLSDVAWMSCDKVSDMRDFEYVTARNLGPSA